MHLVFLLSNEFCDCPRKKTPLFFPYYSGKTNRNAILVPATLKKGREATLQRN